MKNKSWIIIVIIMGIALAISIGYSIIVSQRKANGERTVTTTSIIEMTATTVTIKNTLSGTGQVKNVIIENENAENVNQQNSDNNNQIQETEEITNSYQNMENKIYKVVLSVEDKDIDKLLVSQNADISIRKNENTYIYKGKVIKINKDINNKSTVDVEILNSDENVNENDNANCTIIIEQVENVVGLPVEAIQQNETNEKYVDVVQMDGTTKQTKIYTGLSDNYYVEITSGLNVGDRVQIIKSLTTVVEKEKNTSDK